jgi:hypothetical protein
VLKSGWVYVYYARDGWQWRPRGEGAKDFNIDAIPVSILGLTLPVLQFALSIDRVLNGVTRPFFGWMSTISVARTRCSSRSFFEGIGIYALLHFASDPLLVFFAWGEIYSLFPATSLTSMDGSSLPRTTGCSTRRRERLRY